MPFIVLPPKNVQNFKIIVPQFFFIQIINLFLLLLLPCTEYSSLSVILQRDSQDKSPAGQYLQLKTGGNLIYTVRNWAGGKLPSVSLNSYT